MSPTLGCFVLFFHGSGNHEHSVLVILSDKDEEVRCRTYLLEYSTQCNTWQQI